MLSTFSPNLIKTYMKKSFQFKALTLLAFVVFISNMAFGQQIPVESPFASASGEVAGSKIEIFYHSPSVRGRKIWGGLVPYNEVWRLGANDATIFQTSQAVKINGKTLPAGKYSLYAFPTKTSWKIMFNSETGQWGINMDGSTTEDHSKDVLTATVIPVKSASMNEHFKIVVNDKGFVVLWENLEVPVLISQ
jgi:hypothetical protein